MNICESNHSRSRDARALHGHNKKYSSQIPRESAGFKVAQSENFGLVAPTLQPRSTTSRERMQYLMAEPAFNRPPRPPATVCGLNVSELGLRATAVVFCQL